MENSYQTNDVLDQHRPKELPGMLNTLTILTFIGCGLGYIGRRQVQQEHFYLWC